MQRRDHPQVEGQPQTGAAQTVGRRPGGWLRIADQEIPLGLQQAEGQAQFSMSPVVEEKMSVQVQPSIAWTALNLQPVDFAFPLVHRQHRQAHHQSGSLSNAPTCSAI